MSEPWRKRVGELEYKALYALVVAGKSAKFAEAFMGRFLERFCSEGQSIFDCIIDLNDKGILRAALEECRSGNYGKLCRALPMLARLTPEDLATWTPADLEKIPGIGPKTSRFFILWTRPDARVAALDVHILRWLREHGYDAPRTTPANPKTYARLEAAFLQEADKRGMSPRDFDYSIWQEGSGYADAAPLFTQTSDTEQGDGR